MITRHFQKGDAWSTAIYSECEHYRYSLTRIWDPNKLRVLFIMLNPSTATEYQNDPTVERCERRARFLGFGSFRVCNIFAWRETDPKIMRKVDDPVGPENDRHIIKSAHWANQIICAWGTHGAFNQRGPHVQKFLETTTYPLYHFGLSREGHPKHPLYIAYAHQPVLWTVNKEEQIHHDARS